MPGPAPTTARPAQELEELGLTPYQARVLVALLHVGTATTAGLAERSGVRRTSIYPVLKKLAAQGLTYPVPTHGPATWACDGWNAILDTLDASAEEQLRQHHTRTRRLRYPHTDEMVDAAPANSGIYPPAVSGS